MYDGIPLNDAIHETLSNHLAADGGGMVTDFVLVARAFDQNAENGMYVVCPDTTPASTGLGLLAYAEEWFRWDVRTQIANHLSCDCDTDEDER
jgi:hypothetical protein